jgi:hypothetical protein
MLSITASAAPQWAFAGLLAAMVAIFRFKTEPLQTLLACSAAGPFLHFVVVVG